MSQTHASSAFHEGRPWARQRSGESEAGRRGGCPISETSRPSARELDRVLTAESPKRQAARADGDAGRTNPEWLTSLRMAGDPAREQAVAELVTYVRAGLAKAFAGQSGVDETDLDDFTQEAIIQVLDGLDSFRGDSRFTTWAMAVSLRATYSELRRRRRAHDSLTVLGRPAAQTAVSRRSRPMRADRAVERRDVIAALRRAIDDRLTGRQRAAILARLHGVSHERSARLLRTNRNALYKLLHDARKSLRRALNDMGFNDEDVRRELAEDLT